MSGASHCHRPNLPPRPPPLPACPSPPLRPPCASLAAGSATCDTGPPIVFLEFGRIGVLWPVRRSNRCSAPSCACAYTMFGSSQSTLGWNPSPPPTRIQSLVRIPTRLRVREGPQTDPLSCAPPHT